MKKKPTLDQEAKRLRKMTVTGAFWNWDDLLPKEQSFWLRLVRHVRRREAAAFKRGCKGVAEFGRKFESLAHTK